MSFEPLLKNVHVLHLIACERPIAHIAFLSHQFYRDQFNTNAALVNILSNYWNTIFNHNTRTDLFEELIPMLYARSNDTTINVSDNDLTISRISKENTIILPELKIIAYDITFYINKSGWIYKIVSCNRTGPDPYDLDIRSMFTRPMNKIKKKFILETVEFWVGLLRKLHEHVAPQPKILYTQLTI